MSCILNNFALLPPIICSPPLLSVIDWYNFVLCKLWNGKHVTSDSNRRSPVQKCAL